MFGGTFSRHNVVRCVDERDVGKRLRKISELAAKNGIVLLGQQANVVSQIEQTQEKLPRLLVTARDRIVVREPERARQERSLTRRQAVDAGLGWVPEHQAVVHQFPLDRSAQLKPRADPWPAESQPTES